jgi:protein tyrosine phosphatase
MASTLSRSLYDQPFKDIFDFAETGLLHIAHLWQSKEIDPEIQIRTSLYDKPKKAVKKIHRIGFYPVAANPFHWAHLLIGLWAMTEFKLDKVIFLIAGFDPRKPDLVPMAIRHAMGKEVLKNFDPLFEYSPIAISHNKTKSAFALWKEGRLYSYVITVCDESSAEQCPVFPGIVKRLHWSFPDPASFIGSHEEKLAKVREVRDRIKQKVLELISENKDR